jgi:hypothetical protein
MVLNELRGIRSGYSWLGTTMGLPDTIGLHCN